jgi:hypothetical protein
MPDLWTSEYLLRWVVAFAITQGVECPIYVRVFRLSLGRAFLPSAVTHPVVCFVMPLVWDAIARAVQQRVGPLSDELYFLGYGVIAEGFAFSAESFYFARICGLGTRRGILCAVVGNAASGLVGLIASWLTGWP